MPFREISSAIAGTTMAPGRQDALRVLRQRIQEAPQDRRRRFLKLIPEPTNQWDADAIQVWAHVPNFGAADAHGWFQLGFIRNGETYCTFCETVHAAYPKPAFKGGPPRCNKCHSEGAGFFERRGTAKKVAEEMRKDPHATYYAVITEVTGGDEARGKNNLGCNILICRALKKDEQGAQTAQGALPDTTSRAVAPRKPAASRKPAAAPPVLNPTAPNRFYDWDDAFEDA